MAAPSSNLTKTIGAIVLILAALAAAKLGLVPGSAPTAPAGSSGLPTSAAPAASPTKTSPAAPAAGAATLRIGTWNIEWLGKPEDRSGPAKGVAQKPEDLADLIAQSGVSVLAVEEVVSRERGLPIRSRELEATMDLLEKQRAGHWHYVLFPGRNDGDQLTGVMWNQDAVTALNTADNPWNQTSDKPYELPIPKGRGPTGSSLWNRPPHAMKFSGGTGKSDFVVVIVHMKADYNGDFAAHREKEAESLVDALPAVRRAFHDQDIVILGDSNCTGDHEPAIIDLEKAGFYDTNSAHAKTHWRGGTMDRIMTPSGQPEFARHNFEVFSETYMKKRGLSPKEYKTKFSDHYMVVTTIDIGDDDD